MSARSWVIDVCKTCDRLAQWPFCEHRSDQRWTQTVVVYTNARRPKALAARPVPPGPAATRDGEAGK